MRVGSKVILYEGVDRLFFIFELEGAVAFVQVTVRFFERHLALLLHKVICEDIFVLVDVEGLFFFLFSAEECGREKLGRAVLALRLWLSSRFTYECCYSCRQYILLLRLLLLCRLVNTRRSLFIALQSQHLQLVLDTHITCSKLQLALILDRRRFNWLNHVALI